MPDDATRKAVGCSATLLMLSNVAAVALLAVVIPVAQWGMRPLAEEAGVIPVGPALWLLRVPLGGVIAVALGLIALLMFKHWRLKSPGWKLAVEVIATTVVTAAILLFSVGAISLLSQVYQAMAGGASGP